MAEPPKPPPEKERKPAPKKGKGRKTLTERADEEVAEGEQVEGNVEDDSKYSTPCPV